MASLLLERNEPQDRVETLEAFEVGTQIVEEDARQRVACNPRKRRVARRSRWGRHLPPELAHCDHQHSPSTEMKRRRERCNLPDRPVGVVVLAGARRRKYERYRGGGEQVLDGDRGAFSAPARALPRQDRFRGLEE